MLLQLRLCSCAEKYEWHGFLLYTEERYLTGCPFLYVFTQWRSQGLAHRVRYPFLPPPPPRACRANFFFGVAYIDQNDCLPAPHPPRDQRGIPFLTLPWFLFFYLRRCLCVTAKQRRGERHECSLKLLPPSQSRLRSPPPVGGGGEGHTFGSCRSQPYFSAAPSRIFVVKV